MAGKQAIIGRAKTVLVTGHGEAAKAVVSTIVARPRRATGRKRLVVKGPVTFKAAVVRHINETVLPVLDQVSERLGIKGKPKSFEISVVNPGAASAVDVGVTVSGFSADAAILVALSSAWLRMPVPQNVVATGHVASVDGDLRTVRSIPAKLDAAIRDPGVQRFVCPSLDADISMQVLSSTERERASDAITNAKARIQVTEVTAIDDLFRIFFVDKSVVLAGFEKGFHEVADRFERGGSPIDRAVAHLAADNEGRFWRVLETSFMAGRVGEAQALLLARMRYHNRGKQYSKRLGTRLFQLILSLPPAVRRIAGIFPLLPWDQCKKMCQFATEEDQEDALLLMDAIRGRIGRRQDKQLPTEPSGATDTNGAAAVEAILAEIDSATLARKIGLPIDTARVAYVLTEVTTDSHDEFLDIITSFYLTLMRHTGAGLVSADEQQVQKDALDLLDEAFRDRGGLGAARAEARDGINGGTRFVLNVMTEQFKTDEQIKHVRRILKAALDPLDWNEQVRFMTAFLQRIAPVLPPEIRAAPPERFARHYEQILQAYARSFDRVKQLLRNL